MKHSLANVYRWTLQVSDIECERRPDAEFFYRSFLPDLLPVFCRCTGLCHMLKDRTSPMYTRGFGASLVSVMPPLDDWSCYPTNSTGSLLSLIHAMGKRSGSQLAKHTNSQSRYRQSGRASKDNVLLRQLWQGALKGRILIRGGIRARP